jgi:hypothetical protein
MAQLPQCIMMNISTQFGCWLGKNQATFRTKTFAGIEIKWRRLHALAPSKSYGGNSLIDRGKREKKSVGRLKVGGDAYIVFWVMRGAIPVLE